MNILYEDNHIVAVNKQVSDIVQGDKTGDISLDTRIKQYLKEKYNKPGNVFLGVVHRLDRPVSGIVLFAKTSKSLSRLNKMFKQKEIGKIYWAVVKVPPPSQKNTLTHYLVRNTKLNKSFVHNKEMPDSKLAILHYKLLFKSSNYYLLEIQLETGRHHQIRSQLAKINCPIKGDLKYGFDRSNKNAGIHLHAKKISFIHPVSKQHIVIEAPPPKDPLWDEFMKKAKD